VARLVADALKGGGEGPERRSEARLLAEIARSEDRRRVASRRSWVMPAFAVTGWVGATLGCGLFAYQIGIHQGEARSQELALTALQRISSMAIAPAPAPMERPAASNGENARPPVKMAKKESGKPKPKDVMPPSLRMNVNEIYSGDDLLAHLPSADRNASPAESEQEQLLRDATALLSQGKWDAAASGFEEAAGKIPNSETAMDALHLSGAIAERALDDPKRAAEIYRKELDLGRRVLESDRSVPAEPVKQRLARAMTNLGLLERNPRLIQRAAEHAESAPAESSP
jgi:hypothetical protein